MTSRGEVETQPLLRIEELLDPSVFPHPVTRIQLLETHISWVVLTGSRAYKIKKPVQFDFIDASTLERRRHLCNEELRLNRRLAPDIYLDVVAITRVNGRASVGGDLQSVIEYAVCMTQFDAEQELSALLDRNDVSTEQVTELAELLAEFHLQAPVASDRDYQNTEHMYAAVVDNLQDLSTHIELLDQPGNLQQLIDWTRDAARTLDESFHDREVYGKVRECHSDLHSGNIVRWQGRLVPFDCIDFNPDLRRIDVMNDIAFLVMDLTAHGHSDLAAALLNRYLEITGDYDGVALLPFYAVYRALVRAKVDAITAAQSVGKTAEVHERLQRRIQAAMRWTKRPRSALILTHGPSGSGKSWLSAQLVSALPALCIRSDVERKRLAGVNSATSAAAPNQGIYVPQISHRTYARLLECAESCLEAGFHVIVDATFLESADRELFCGLAARLRTPFIIVSCEADAATLAGRVRARAASAKDPSDADQTVLDAQLRTWKPLDERELPAVIAVDTEQSNAAKHLVSAVRARL